MRKRTGGVAIMAAAAFLTIYPFPTENKETLREVSPQVTEDQGSDFLQGKENVLPMVPVTLVETIDGDTIKVRVKGKIETVRYLLVDTPESKNPKMCVQHFAKEAFLRNSELVKKGKLTLELEKGNSRDSYGRLLAYVYVDGESVQGTLLKEGYARLAYIINPPYQYLEQFRGEERLAKTEKINIWSRGEYVTGWGFDGCLD